jgi:hypothetical protein
MSISTYGELKTAVANWLNDSTLISRIPEFIVYAESLIHGDPESDLPGVRCRNMFKRVTTTVTTEYFDAPTDLLEIKDIEVQGDPDSALDYLSPKAMTKKFPSSFTGTPEYYTIIGDEFQVKPVPSSSVLEIAYYAKFTAFSDDADANWLLTNHPFIYLYGALIAAMPYLREDTDFKTEYAMLVNNLNMAERHVQRGFLTPRVNTATP